MAPTLESLTSLFPLTSPVPTPLTHPNLVSTKDVHREEDLLSNADSFRQWWSTIISAKDSAVAEQKLAPSSSSPPSAIEVQLLGTQLSTAAGRLSFQRLTYLYESALARFPTSFKLWKAYLQMRTLYVLGKGTRKKRSGGRKKWTEMKEMMDDEEAEMEVYEEGLDGVVGWSEWKALIACFERALMWLPTMPRIWLMYFTLFTHPKCPAPILYTHARRTFDRSLRTLPPSLHARIWPAYLIWAERRGGHSTVMIYRRYLKVDPSLTERYVGILLGTGAEGGSAHAHAPRPLEAAKLLLLLARKAAKGEYTSPEGKSPYQLLGEWLEVVERYADEVGMDPDQADALRAASEASKKQKEAEAEALKAQIEQEARENPASSETGNLIRFAGPPVALPSSTGAGTGVGGEEGEDVDPANARRLDVEGIVKRDGLEVYKDQAGRLWTGLATYWIKRGEFDRAKATFEEGLSSVLTVRDFTQIFDAYAEFSESVISALMSSLEDLDDEEIAETEQELDERMKSFEELMERRPFLVNEVLLRRNPNDVQEWEKRVLLWGDNDDKVAETYTSALRTISPRKSTPNFHNLFVSFAKFYESGGVSQLAEPDLNSARRVLEKGTKTGFRTVEELADVWCEWGEMELRNENYDEAIRVMQRATAIPKNPKISYHDQSLPVQSRLFKSLKLWSYYVDLEESIGTVETTKAVYDKILDLRIANAQIIVNYAKFLEENQYFEESFKVYERGVELFTYPVAFELWNIYLSKFVKRYGGDKLERARDLFEQALEKCPEKFCKPIFLMYAKLEEDFGLAKRAMKIYERAASVVEDKDKFDMYTIYIAKATENYGLPATRPIYERALDVLPNRQAAQMCLRFASLERKLGEIDRARAIYAHASQFCDPRVDGKFWADWNAFEIETGSEETFREMLRIKRSVQALFNTAASYIVAQAEASKRGGGGGGGGGGAEETGGGGDAMAAAEREAGKSGPSFVASTLDAPKAADEGDVGNADEIQIDDEDF